jgi:hypothetical protein
VINKISDRFSPLPCTLALRWLCRDLKGEMEGVRPNFLIAQDGAIAARLPAEIPRRLCASLSVAGGKR